LIADIQYVMFGCLAQQLCQPHHQQFGILNYISSAQSLTDCETISIPLPQNTENRSTQTCSWDHTSLRLVDIDVTHNYTRTFSSTKLLTVGCYCKQSPGWQWEL